VVKGFVALPRCPLGLVTAVAQNAQGRRPVKSLAHLWKRMSMEHAHALEGWEKVNKRFSSLRRGPARSAAERPDLGKNLAIDYFLAHNLVWKEDLHRIVIPVLNANLNRVSFLV
jgi:hypothetical protein